VIALEPSIVAGFERGIAVLAVGYFAPDDEEILCVHAADDLAGAERCRDAERKNLQEERERVRRGEESRWN